MLLPLLAQAEATYITIPGEGWSLRINGPTLSRTEGQVKGRVFRYIAGNLDAGLTISVNTETEGGASNAACRDLLWPRILQYPNLVKGSEKLFGNNVALFGTHRSEGVYKGTPFRTANGHAYIAKRGLCVDVHVSHWPYDDGSERTLAELLQSITIVE